MRVPSLPLSTTTPLVFSPRAYAGKSYFYNSNLPLSARQLTAVSAPGSELQIFLRVPSVDGPATAEASSSQHFEIDPFRRSACPGDLGDMLSKPA